MRYIIFVALLAYATEAVNLQGLWYAVTDTYTSLNAANNSVAQMIGRLHGVIAYAVVNNQKSMLRNSVINFIESLNAMEVDDSTTSFANNIRAQLLPKVDQIYNTINPDLSDAHNLRIQYFNAAKTLVDIPYSHTTPAILTASFLGRNLIEVKMRQATRIANEAALFIQEEFYKALRK